MSFAFLVHPRTDVRRDMARLWPPLGRIPASAYDVALRRLPVPPLHLAAVEVDGRVEGSILLVPFTARQLLDDPREGARRVAQAVDRASAEGADVVGLGGLTAPVTGGGLALRHRTDIAVTNGNAYTAVVVHRQARDLLDRPGASTGRVAVIGATGSVGTAVCRLLARDGDASRLTLVARNEQRLSALADRLGGGVRTGASMDAVAECDTVVLLTASADTLLRPEHLRRAAVVLDATQPRNTSPALLERRPDVTVLDGGVVEVPSLRLLGGNIGLPAGLAYACLAETVLLSLAGHTRHFSLGRPTIEQLVIMRELAARRDYLGFGPAAPSSFGRLIGAGEPVAA